MFASLSGANFMLSRPERSVREEEEGAVCESAGDSRQGCSAIFFSLCFISRSGALLRARRRRSEEREKAGGGIAFRETMRSAVDPSNTRSKRYDDSRVREAQITPLALFSSELFCVSIFSSSSLNLRSPASDSFARFSGVI